MHLAILLALQVPSGGTQVVNPSAVFRTEVAGLAATGSTAEVVTVTNQQWTQALRVTVQKSSAETNATQLTVPNIASVKAGDTVLASFWAQGRAASGAAGHLEFLFEKATNPWTKSATFDVSTGRYWQLFQVAFTVAQPYEPGEAMASFRFAFGPQSIDLGPVTVTDFGTSRTVESLMEEVLDNDPIGPSSVTFDTKNVQQTMRGFGGDFCQARYGQASILDSVGKYVLDHLTPVHARVGLPLNYWEPKPGEFHDDAQAAASLGTLALMTRRGIPTVVSIWEAPTWMLGGKPEQSGRELPKGEYSDCIESIGRYLVLARNKYKAEVDFLSFNEPDYGVNFKFTPDTMRDFIRRAGSRFAQLGLRTKFLVGDTSGGARFSAFATPILSDPTIAKYLGPISFHCWDVLGSSDAQYENIRALGKRFNKPVWCLEAGHDAGLWAKPSPWGSWDNALRTAMAYEKTIRLSGAELMDYWTYENNYPVVDPAGKPYPVFDVLSRMEAVLKKGAKVVLGASSVETLLGLGTVDANGSLRALLVNTGGPGKIKISGFRPGVAVDVFRMTWKGTEHDADSTDGDGAIIAYAPTRSVVTIVPR